MNHEFFKKGGWRRSQRASLWGALTFIFLSLGSLSYAASSLYYLSGIFADSDSNPVQGFVSAVDVSNENLVNYVNVSGGNYRLALFPGTYDVLGASVISAPAGTIYLYTPTQRITVGGDTTLNILIPLPVFYHVRGKVTDGGGVGLGEVSIWMSGQRSTSTTRTLADGSYDALVISDLYQVEITPPGGTRFPKVKIENLTVAGDTAWNISLREAFLLHGQVRDDKGNPMAAGVSASTLDGVRVDHFTWSDLDGAYRIPLSAGTYRVNASVFPLYFQGDEGVYLNLPEQAVTVSADTELNITYPSSQYQFFRQTGQVTDLHGAGQGGVLISIYDSVGICGSFPVTSAEGFYQTFLIAGNYTTDVFTPGGTQPPIEVKKIDVASDTVQTFRLTEDYSLLDTAKARLSGDLELKLNLLDIVNRGASATYDMVIRPGKEKFQVIMNWPGDSLRLTLYRPDGTVYGEYSGTKPPLIVEVPQKNGELVPGIWKCKVTALDVPQDNYPFALVTGVTPNKPPVANIGEPRYSGKVGEAITFDAGRSSDPDGTVAIYQWDWNEDGLYDEKSRSPVTLRTWSAPYQGPISLRVLDDEGLTSTTVAEVKIVGANHPPVANAGPDQTVAADAACKANVLLDGTASYDPDGDPLTYAWEGSFGTAAGPTPRVGLAQGLIPITLTVNDGKGGVSSDGVQITVKDQTPPTILSLHASPSVLWPPNNRMEPVTLAVSRRDNCDPNPVCKITDIRSNESSGGNMDWQITGDLKVKLRADRDGNGIGRVYTITVKCTDVSRNEATSTTRVFVPHDQAKK
jgi:hypothetical protein